MLAFTMWKQNIPVKMLPTVSIEPRPLMNLWFQVQHYPFYTKWAFDCKTETLGSLYSHALLNIAKSSQFLQVQNQVMHEQKFKDLLSSTLGTWIQYSLRVRFCYWIFLFSHSKASDANVGIIANFVYYGKTRLGAHSLWCQQSGNIPNSWHFQTIKADNWVFTISNSARSGKSDRPISLLLMV